MFIYQLPIDNAMLKMSRPIPNGIHPDYVFPVKLANALKVDSFISSMPVREWADITAMIKAHAAHAAVWKGRPMH